MRINILKYLKGYREHNLYQHKTKDKILINQYHEESISQIVIGINSEFEPLLVNNAWQLTHNYYYI